MRVGRVELVEPDRLDLRHVLRVYNGIPVQLSVVFGMRRFYQFHRDEGLNVHPVGAWGCRKANAQGQNALSSVYLA